MDTTKKHWIYILECEDGRYYTGYTTDLLKRFNKHLEGSASKFTRSFKPLRIAQSWICLEKATALSLEKTIKALSRAEKEKLIQDPKKAHQLRPDLCVSLPDKLHDDNRQRNTDWDNT